MEMERRERGGGDEGSPVDGGEMRGVEKKKKLRHFWLCSVPEMKPKLVTRKRKRKRLCFIHVITYGRHRVISRGEN